jgi:UDP-GlcNAc:undecaprenyl-phosphate GlcNAc-1-phosphate transferase
MIAFPANVYLTAFLSALICACLSTPLWRRWCLQHNHVDDPGHRKIHSHPIPLAGGLAVLTGIILPISLAMATSLAGWLNPNALPIPLDPTTSSLFAYGFHQRSLQLAAIGLGALGMTALGYYDDHHELKPGPKFLGQLAIALLIAASGIRITLFLHVPLLSYTLTVLWILTITNACNFMDNMNGLCTGLGLIGIWCFAWTSAIQGQFLVASLGFLTCGALLGFLPFNFPKASSFLGDAGSHLIGYLLAILAILPNFYSTQSPSKLAVLKPLLVLGVILGDLISVVIIRYRNHQPFYIGDTNHISHRLVRRGLSHSTAVLAILLLAALLATLSILL